MGPVYLLTGSCLENVGFWVKKILLSPHAYSFKIIKSGINIINLSSYSKHINDSQCDINNCCLLEKVVEE